MGVNIYRCNAKGLQICLVHLLNQSYESEVVFNKELCQSKARHVVDMFSLKRQSTVGVEPNQYFIKYK